MKAIGLISGTSLDGIDAAIIEIPDLAEHKNDSSVRMIGLATYPYPEGVRERILQISAPGKGTVDQICHLNAYIGELFARAAVQIAQESGIALDQIDVIGSHGQTIHHLPQPQDERGIRVTSTLQIGEPSIIAERTGITTVADFRPRDMAAGGQGAPFAPFAHYRLFRHPTRYRIVTNIGGISNVTYLPPNAAPNQVIAFDTGPGNMLLDAIAFRVSHGEEIYDIDGRRAARGTCHPALLAWMLDHPYFRRTPPKSTGREEFGEHFLDEIYARQRQFGMSDYDLLATATCFTAESIAKSYQAFLPAYRELAAMAEPPVDLLFCGGGVKNLTLMTRLQDRLAPLPIFPVERFNLSSDALEAITFAILACETILGRPTNLPSVTGACRPVILGKIVPGNRFRGL